MELFIMFVTYVVLDPRKPGRFQSPTCSFLFQPVYVGKGTNKRVEGIINILVNESAKPHAGIMFHKWLIGMRNLGFTSLPIIVIDQETEEFAFAEERIFTKHFGLKANGGILFNSREGGDGGWSLTMHTKELLSLANSGANNPNWGKKWTEERRAKWKSTWESKVRTRNPEAMMNAWRARQRTYVIISPDREYQVDDLTKFCTDNDLPLSSFRKALKEPNGVVKSKKRKSKVEGWIIKYLI